jgi:hypothetical protein
VQIHLSSHLMASIQHEPVSIHVWSQRRLLLVVVRVLTVHLPHVAVIDPLSNVNCVCSIESDVAYVHLS